MEPDFSNHRLRKRLRQIKQVKGNDTFTRLPDEVIVSNILSRFTLEEGARYNILSHRWKKLWACTIGSTLCFAPEHLRTRLLTKSTKNARKGMDYRVCKSRSSSRLEESVDYKINRLRVCFACWISNVLQAHCRPKLDELTVRFPFDFSNQDSIDMWVECALKKGVTRLELDLRRWGELVSLKRYRFPKIEKLQLQGLLANCDGLFNLRDVTLRGVIMSHDDIEFMLAHFPLERLCVGLTGIGTLSVCGASVRLKTLEMVRCIGDLKISAPSLTSLTYSGPDSSLLLEHVPHLSELSVDREFCSTFIPTCFLKRGCISQLRRLKFVMSEQALRRSINYPFEFPETLNLEELEIEIDIENGIDREEDACLLWPLLLIKAAPFLHKVSIELLPSRCTGYGQSSQLYNGLTNAAKRVRHHQYLRTIELNNYYGYPCELELAESLLHVSEVLELVLVSPFSVDRECAPVFRSRAQAIAQWLPPWSKAKLIVL